MKPDLSTLKKLCAKPTQPGPYKVTNQPNDRGDNYAVLDDNGCWVGDFGCVKSEADYFAGAATHLPSVVAEVEALQALCTEQASQLLDPDATCCADASRKAKAMRLAHETEVAKLRSLNDAWSESAATSLAEMDAAKALANIASECLTSAEKECHRLRARLARIEPVFEAAKAWRANEIALEHCTLPEGSTHLVRLRRGEWQTIQALRDAIDAALAEKEQG